MNKSVRFLWLLLGLCAVGLGFVGIFLPFLPTTPFMILAAWAFARSSPRLHRWLLAHPIFGQLIRDWQAHRAIPPRAKRLALVMMAAAFALSVALGVKPIVLLLQGLLLLALGTWLATRPNPPKDSPPPPDQSQG